MSVLLIFVRLPLVVIWLVSSLLFVATVYPLSSLSMRNRMNRGWSRAIVAICGVKTTVLGQPTLKGSTLWVANHVSWIDIFILAGVRSVLFVAKSEIRSWPVVGWLVAKVGAVFLDRKQRNSLKVVGEEMKRRFAQGEVIGLFAEGTTSPGYDVLPFHSSLFDPAMRANVDIQPVALRFFYDGQRSDYAAFVGDETLVGNLWTLLGSTGIAVEVEFLPALEAATCQEMGRADVSRHLHQAIGSTVRRGVTQPESLGEIAPQR